MQDCDLICQVNPCGLHEFVCSGWQLSPKNKQLTNMLCRLCFHEIEMSNVRHDKCIDKEKAAHIEVE